MCLTIQARVRLRVSGRDSTRSECSTVLTLWASSRIAVTAITAAAGTRRSAISQRPNETAP